MNNAKRMMHALVAVLASTVLAITAFSVTAHAGDGSNLLSAAPASARAVLVINVESLRGSTIMQDALSAASSQASVANITQALQDVGFDPATDLQTIVAISNTTSDSSARPLILAEGNFPRAAMEQKLATEQRATTSQQGSRTVYEVEGRGATAFVSDTIMAVGPRALVNEALSASDTEGIQLSAAVQGLVGAADRSRNVWFVSMGVRNSQTAGTPLEQISGFAASINAVGGLNMTIKAAASSADAATQLAGELRTQIEAAGSIDVVAALGLSSVLQSINVSSAGNIATVEVQMPEGRWNRLFNTLKSALEEELR